MKACTPFSSRIAAWNRKNGAPSSSSARALVPHASVLAQLELRASVHGEPHALCGAHWDHEPKMRNLFICKGGIFRFMGSLHPFFRAHCDHEPYLRKSLVCKSTIFRFMESLRDFDAAHWDHEPLTAWSPG